MNAAKLRTFVALAAVVAICAAPASAYRMIQNTSTGRVTWASCYQVCASVATGSCAPSGGVDDTLSLTSCCSGAAVSGSTRCLDPTDWANGWASCIHTCL